jgi:hypothetical protein
MTKELDELPSLTVRESFRLLEYLSNALQELKNLQQYSVVGLDVRELCYIVQLLTNHLDPKE